MDITITKFRLKRDLSVDISVRHPKPVVKFVNGDFDYSTAGVWVVQDYPELNEVEVDEVIVVHDTCTYVVVKEDKSRVMTGSAFDYISNEYSIVKMYTLFAACKQVGAESVHMRVKYYDNQSICALSVFTAWICGITSLVFYHDGEYIVPHSVLHTLGSVTTPAKYFVSFTGLTMNQLSPTEVYPRMSSVVSRLRFLEAAREGNIESGRKILTNEVFDIQSTLLEMVDKGKYTFVRLLLEDSRSDPNCNSLVELAAIRGHTCIVEMLLSDPRVGTLTDVVVEL